MRCHAPILTEAATTKPAVDLHDLSEDQITAWIGLIQQSHRKEEIDASLTE